MKSGSIPADDPNFAGYVVEFREQVDFLKKLARDSWTESPPAERETQGKNLRTFDTVRVYLEQELDAITFVDFTNPPPELTERLVKAAIFMHLFDKAHEFHTAAIAINKDGLYSLLDSVRGWTYGLLSKDYFARPAGSIIRDYIDVESQFVACAEICDIKLPSIQSAARNYQAKVLERLKEISAKEENP